MDKSQSENHQGAATALPTRRVMLPLIFVAAAFVVLIGINAEESRRFSPVSTGKGSLALVLEDPTPAGSVVLEADFIPADSSRREKVLKDLSTLADRWKQSGHKVSVTPMDLDDTAVRFAQQLDNWLARYELGVEDPFLNEDMGEVSHPPDVSGLVIRARESNRSRAKALALAIAPLVRGDISIQFTARALSKQLDVFVESAPRFNEAGVAFFSAADVDV